MQVLISRSKWRKFRGSVAIAGLQRGEVRMKAVDSIPTPTGPASRNRVENDLRVSLVRTEAKKSVSACTSERVVWRALHGKNRFAGADGAAQCHVRRDDGVQFTKPVPRCGGSTAPQHPRRRPGGTTLFARGRPVSRHAALSGPPAVSGAHLPFAAGPENFRRAALGARE